MEGYGAWLVAGLAIILGLAGYAVHLLLRLRAQNAQRAEAEAARGAADGVVEFQPAGNEYALGARESIRVLARCYLDGQVGASELCLRIAVLLDQAVIDKTTREQGEVFVRLAAELADIPTHEDWKALNREARDRFRQQMEDLEKRHEQAMREAAQALAKP